MRSLLVCLLVPACGPAPNATLAELPQPTLRVGLGSHADLDPDPELVSLRVTVNVGYDEDAFRAAHGGDCATIDDVTATFAGHAVELEGAGGDISDLDTCSTPYFEAVLPIRVHETEVLRVEVADASDALVAEFAPGTLEARSAELLSHAQARFAYGDLVEIRYSHPEDFAAFDPAYDGVTFTNPELSGTNSTELTDVQLDGDIVRARFTPTNEWGVAGDGVLKFRVGDVAPVTATTCTATRCTGGTVPMYMLPAYLE